MSVMYIHNGWYGKTEGNSLHSSYYNTNLILVSTARKETMHTCKNAHGNRKCGDGMERDNLLRIIYLPYHQLFGCHKCLFDHIRSLMKKNIFAAFLPVQSIDLCHETLKLGTSEILPSSCWNQEVEQLKKNGWEHLSFWVDLYGQTKHCATVSRKDQRF